MLCKTLQNIFSITYVMLEKIMIKLVFNMTLHN
jgi:hypothetical protein